jgi:hypothetical protein
VLLTLAPDHVTVTVVAFIELALTLVGPNGTAYESIEVLDPDQLAVVSIEFVALS